MWFADPRRVMVVGPTAQRMPGTEQQAELGDDGTLYEMVTACPCAAGDGWRKQMAIFDSKWHLPLVRQEDGRRVVGFTIDESEQQRLRDWVVRSRTIESKPQAKQAMIPF